MADFAPDYVQVNERIVAFKKQYPEGVLQSEIVRLDEGLVVMRGLAYRTHDDPRPGIGHSSLTIPGKTPYTRGSELENCETSAWGRALAALGFEVKRGIATQEEVHAKRSAPESLVKPETLATVDPVPNDQVIAIDAAAKALNGRAKVIVETWLKAEGFSGWKGFIASGRAKAPALLEVLKKNAERKEPVA